MQFARPFLLLTLAIVPFHVPAMEPYVATGFPYALVGLAQAVDSSITARIDFATVAHHHYSGSTSDQDYQGVLSYNRAAVLVDWFAFANGFRFTGGMTFNRARATMSASAHNGQIVLGGLTLPAPSSLYSVESEVKMPDVMPFLGIGWGQHSRPDARGFTFNVDLGASIGTAKATQLTPSTPLASVIANTPGGSEALASENSDFQSQIAKIKAIPQLTIGFGYQF